MKIPFVSILLICLLFACKKKKTEDSSKDPYIPHSNRVKCQRNVLPGATNTLISNIQMAYNSAGMLMGSTKVDSSYENQKWSSSITGIQSFSYTSFNKILMRDYSGIVYNFIYDSNNKLQFEIRNLSWLTDTIKYFYIGNIVKKIYVNDPYYKWKYVNYYSQNLDSILMFDSLNVLISRTVNWYNSKPDLTKDYFNTFYTVPDNTFELIKSETQYIKGSYSYYTIVRNYDEQGYPIKETGMVGATAYNFTYYYYY